MWPGSCWRCPGRSGRHAAGAGARSHRGRRRSRGAGQPLAPAGDQSPQVTYTALFALLLGGDQPVHYVTHRLVVVGICVATELAVNVLAFPPLQLRPAEPGTTVSSLRRQSRPAGQRGTHGRACGGTCGPRLNEPYHGPTARCWMS
jgi:hypothetical protein